MATEAKPATTITLKLLIDTASRNVLFAEAGKDFIDFLFGLLQLPLASILSLLGNHSMSASGSLTKIYKSVQDLSNDYFQPNQTKDPILRPKSASSQTKHTLLLNQLAEGYVGSSSSNAVEGYVKGVVTYMVMDDLTVKPMSTISSITLLNALKVKDLGSLEEKTVEIDMDKGYIKGVVIYMLMDDLAVKPKSTIYSITLLNALKVKDLESLEEKTVEIDMDEGLKLLKASFESTTVLTDVFLPPAIRLSP